MKRSIVICPEEGLAEQLTRAVAATDEVWINRIIGRYPIGLELGRILRAHAPEIIFLSFESSERAQGA